MTDDIPYETPDTTIQTDLGEVETHVDETVATLTATGESLAPVVAAIEAAIASPTPVTLLTAAETVLSPATEEELGTLLSQVEAAIGSLVKQGTQEIDKAYVALGTLRTSLFEHISKWGL